MANPLDKFISKGRAKFIVKLPAVPRLSDSVRRGGLGKGSENYDEVLRSGAREWRKLWSG